MCCSQWLLRWWSLWPSCGALFWSVRRGRPVCSVSINSDWDDLQIIFREVQSLCQDPDIKDELKRALPDTLDELAALARSERINLTDPETGQRYVYAVENGTTYELCATFSSERDSDVEVFWNHLSGTHCFTVDALDPP